MRTSGPGFRTMRRFRQRASDGSRSGAHFWVRCAIVWTSGPGFPRRTMRRFRERASDDPKWIHFWVRCSRCLDLGVLDRSRAVPRYFFHLCRNRRRFDDEDGQDFTNADQAWEAGKAAARDLMESEFDAPDPGWKVLRGHRRGRSGPVRVSVSRSSGVPSGPN